MRSVVKLVVMMELAVRKDNNWTIRAFTSII